MTVLSLRPSLRSRRSSVRLEIRFAVVSLASAASFLLRSRRGRAVAVDVADVATPELVVVVDTVAAERRGRGRSVEREVIVVGAMSNSSSVV